MRLELPFQAGGNRHAHVIYAPEKDEIGETSGWVAAVTDITQNKRIEARLRKAEKLAAAGQLAASLAHEINNPLSSVMDVMYLLSEDPALSADSRNLVNMGTSEIARLNRIVRQSLHYYRGGTSPKELDFSALVEESLQVFREKFGRIGIQLTARITPGIVVVGFGDEIRQVVDNLLLNAVEAMPNGGRILVSARPSHDWKTQDRLGVRLTIADTGSGIAPEDMPAVFDPFFTTKSEKGTGLGLWVVRGIVDRHDGSIRMRSTRNHSRSGTVFSVLLPSVRTLEAAAEPVALEVHGAIAS